LKNVKRLSLHLEGGACSRGRPHAATRSAPDAAGAAAGAGRALAGGSLGAEYLGAAPKEHATQLLLRAAHLRGVVRGRRDLRPKACRGRRRGGQFIRGYSTKTRFSFPLSSGCPSPGMGMGMGGLGSSVSRVRAPRVRGSAARFEVKPQPLYRFGASEVRNSGSSDQGLRASGAETQGFGRRPRGVVRRPAARACARPARARRGRSPPRSPPRCACRACRISSNWISGQIG